MLTLQEMRDLVRQGCGGLSEAEFPDTQVDLLLNMSLWAVEDRFKFKTKDRRFRFDMTVGKSTYSIAALRHPIAVRSVALLLAPTDDLTDETQRFKCAHMTRDWYDENVILGTGVQAQPTRWMREDDCLFFDKDPDDTYTVEVNTKQGVESLLEGSVEQTSLPRNWDEIVVQGAITRKHYYDGEYQDARQAANFQVGAIREAVLTVAKEESDNRYARLDVMWDDPTEDNDG